MAWAFHIGMKVLCIRGCSLAGQGYGDEVLPEKGKIYTVRDFDVVYNQDAIFTVEIVNKVRPYKEGNREPPFPADLFRPLHETPKHIELFRSIAASVKEKKVLSFR